MRSEQIHSVLADVIHLQSLSLQPDAKMSTGFYSAIDRKACVAQSVEVMHESCDMRSH